MRTDDLINALAADAAAPPPRRAWSVALAASVFVSFVMMATILKLRPDIADAAAHNPRFLFKFVATLALAIPAVRLAVGLARPDRPAPRLGALALAPFLLAIACAIELWATPEPRWGAEALGTYAPYCVLCVPVFSFAPLAGILYALSRGAPTNQRLAGLIAGLAAGGLGATVYAFHCPDDSPLFLTIWYTLAIGLVAGVGAWLGPRVLRW